MLDLFKAIGLGLVVLLPLANPLTTVALFLGLAGNMNSAERNRQSLMASVYVFAIMMVAYYAGQLVMGNDSNLLIVFYVQIMPDDFVMQLHRF